jgi:sec-independent protein translocase protein TatA
MKPIIAFMGLGFQELLLIALLLIIFFGAKRIPDLARGIGRGIREFKEAGKEAKKDIDKED